MKYVKVKPSNKPFPGAPPKQPSKKLEIDMNIFAKMNGVMMITTHNDSLGIYNQVSTIQDYKEKLTEEFNEVINENDPTLLAGEVMDVMQICVNMIDKLQEDFGVIEPVKTHCHKLIKRGWKSEKVICFSVLEDSKNA